jgi:hypothetical protein
VLLEIDPTSKKPIQDGGNWYLNYYGESL